MGRRCPSSSPLLLVNLRKALSPSLEKIVFIGKCFFVLFYLFHGSLFDTPFSYLAINI